jgi:hypothetical protein
VKVDIHLGVWCHSAVLSWSPLNVADSRGPVKKKILLEEDEEGLRMAVSGRRQGDTLVALVALLILSSTALALTCNPFTLAGSYVRQVYPADPVARHNSKCTSKIVVKRVSRHEMG